MLKKAEAHRKQNTQKKSIDNEDILADDYIDLQKKKAK